jgi:hypothetical protein
MAGRSGLRNNQHKKIKCSFSKGKSKNESAAHNFHYFFSTMARRLLRLIPPSIAFFQIGLVLVKA